MKRYKVILPDGTALAIEFLSDDLERLEAFLKFANLDYLHLEEVNKEKKKSRPWMWPPGVAEEKK